MQVYPGDIQWVNTDRRGRRAWIVGLGRVEGVMRGFTGRAQMQSGLGFRELDNEVREALFIRAEQSPNPSQAQPSKAFVQISELNRTRLTTTTTLDSLTSVDKTRGSPPDGRSRIWGPI